MVDRRSGIEPGSLVPHHQCQTAREVELVISDRPGMRVRRGPHHRESLRRDVDQRCDFDDRKNEYGTRGGTNDLRRKRIDGSRCRHQRCSTRSSSAADHGAHIARVLHPVGNQYPSVTDGLQATPWRHRHDRDMWLGRHRRCHTLERGVVDDVDGRGRNRHLAGNEILR